MYVLALTMLLESPLLMTGVANGEENSGTTLDYIPGSAIRGACIAAYLRAHAGNTPLDLPWDDESRILFFSDQICFLNGYLAHPRAPTKRALPTPLSWQARKADLEDRDKDDDNDEQRTVWDRVLAGKNEELAEGATLRAEPRSFFWQGAEEAIPLATPARHITVHNSSDDPRLKGAGTSTVFRYVALAAGQRFIAYVISPDATLLDQIERYLPDGPLYLGGSQTAGYGLVRLSVSRLPTAWTWTKGEAEVQPPENDCQVLTLLSDALLRTPEGQPTTELAEALRVALNKPAGWVPRDCFSRAHLTGGFNRKWGLPLPQSWAVSRGSTLVYAAGALTQQELETLLTVGIGERRNEGFGRLGLNISPTDTFQTTSLNPSVVEAGTLSERSKLLAQRMAERRLMNAVRAAIPRYLKQLGKPNQRPKNAQLSRLRQILRDAKRDTLGEEVEAYLTGLREPAKKQLALLLPTRDKQPWAAWLQTRATQLDALTVLKLDPQVFSITGEAVGEETLQKINREATVLLMDAVLRWGTKQEGGDSHE